MKVTIVQNGVLSIALTPETEIEKLALAELAKGDITFKIHDTLSILDKVNPNVGVLSTKPIPQPKNSEDGKEKPIS